MGEATATASSMPAATRPTTQRHHRRKKSFGTKRRSSYERVKPTLDRGRSRGRSRSKSGEKRNRSRSGNRRSTSNNNNKPIPKDICVKENITPREDDDDRRDEINGDVGDSGGSSLTAPTITKEDRKTTAATLARVALLSAADESAIDGEESLPRAKRPEKDPDTTNAADNDNAANTAENYRSIGANAKTNTENATKSIDRPSLTDKYHADDIVNGMNVNAVYGRSGWTSTKKKLTYDDQEEEEDEEEETDKQQHQHFERSRKRSRKLDYLAGGSHHPHNGQIRNASKIVGGDQEEEDARPAGEDVALTTLSSYGIHQHRTTNNNAEDNTTKSIPNKSKSSRGKSGQHSSPSGIQVIDGANSGEFNATATTADSSQAKTASQRRSSLASRNIILPGSKSRSGNNGSGGGIQNESCGIHHHHDSIQKRGQGQLLLSQQQLLLLASKHKTTTVQYMATYHNGEDSILDKNFGGKDAHMFLIHHGDLIVRQDCANNERGTFWSAKFSFRRWKLPGRRSVSARPAILGDGDGDGDGLDEKSGDAKDTASSSKRPVLAVDTALNSHDAELVRRFIKDAKAGQTPQDFFSESEMPLKYEEGGGGGGGGTTKLQMKKKEDGFGLDDGLSFSTSEEKVEQEEKRRVLGDWSNTAANREAIPIGDLRSSSIVGNQHTLSKTKSRPVLDNRNFPRTKSARRKKRKLSPGAEPSFSTTADILTLLPTETRTSKENDVDKKTKKRLATRVIRFDVPVSDDGKHFGLIEGMGGGEEETERKSILPHRGRLMEIPGSIMSGIWDAQVLDDRVSCDKTLPGSQGDLYSLRISLRHRSMKTAPLERYNTGEVAAPEGHVVSHIKPCINRISSFIKQGIFTDDELDTCLKKDGKDERVKQDSSLVLGCIGLATFDGFTSSSESTNKAQEISEAMLKRCSEPHPAGAHQGVYHHHELQEIAGDDENDDAAVTGLLFPCKLKFDNEYSLFIMQDEGFHVTAIDIIFRKPKDPVRFLSLEYQQAHDVGNLTESVLKEHKMGSGLDGAGDEIMKRFLNDLHLYYDLPTDKNAGKSSGGNVAALTTDQINWHENNGDDENIEAEQEGNFVQQLQSPSVDYDQKIQSKFEPNHIQELTVNADSEAELGRNDDVQNIAAEYESKSGQEPNENTCDEALEKIEHEAEYQCNYVQKPENGIYNAAFDKNHMSDVNEHKSKHFVQELTANDDKEDTAADASAEEDLKYPEYNNESSTSKVLDQRMDNFKLSSSSNNAQMKLANAGDKVSAADGDDREQVGSQVRKRVPSEGDALRKDKGPTSLVATQTDINSLSMSNIMKEKEELQQQKDGDKSTVDDIIQGSKEKTEIKASNESTMEHDRQHNANDAIANVEVRDNVLFGCSGCDTFEDCGITLPIGPDHRSNLVERGDIFQQMERSDEKKVDVETGEGENAVALPAAHIVLETSDKSNQLASSNDTESICVKKGIARKIDRNGDNMDTCTATNNNIGKIPKKPGIRKDVETKLSGEILPVSGDRSIRENDDEYISRKIGEIGQSDQHPSENSRKVIAFKDDIDESLVATQAAAHGVLETGHKTKQLASSNDAESSRVKKGIARILEKTSDNEEAHTATNNDIGKNLEKPGIREGDEKKLSVKCLSSSGDRSIRKNGDTSTTREIRETGLSGQRPSENSRKAIAFEDDIDESLGGICAKGNAWHRRNNASNTTLDTGSIRTTLKKGSTKRNLCRLKMRETEFPATFSTHDKLGDDEFAVASDGVSWQAPMSEPPLRNKKSSSLKYSRRAASSSTHHRASKVAESTSAKKRRRNSTGTTTRKRPKKRLPVVDLFGDTDSLFGCEIISRTARTRPKKEVLNVDLSDDDDLFGCEILSYSKTQSARKARLSRKQSSKTSTLQFTGFESKHKQYRGLKSNKNDKMTESVEHQRDSPIKHTISQTNISNHKGSTSASGAAITQDYHAEETRNGRSEEIRDHESIRKGSANTNASKIAELRRVAHASSNATITQDCHAKETPKRRSEEVRDHESVTSTNTPGSIQPRRIAAAPNNIAISRKGEEAQDRITKSIENREFVGASENNANAGDTCCHKDDACVNTSKSVGSERISHAQNNSAIIQTANSDDARNHGSNPSANRVKCVEYRMIAQTRTVTTNIQVGGVDGRRTPPNSADPETVIEPADNDGVNNDGNNSNTDAPDSPKLTNSDEIFDDVEQGEEQISDQDLEFSNSGELNDHGNDQLDRIRRDCQSFQSNTKTTSSNNIAAQVIDCPSNQTDDKIAGADVPSGNTTLENTNNAAGDHSDNQSVLSIDGASCPNKSCINDHTEHESTASSTSSAQFHDTISELGSADPWQQSHLQSLSTVIESPSSKSQTFPSYHCGQGMSFKIGTDDDAESICQPFHDVYFGLDGGGSMFLSEQDMSSLLGPPRYQSFPFYDYHFGQESGLGIESANHSNTIHLESVHSPFYGVYFGLDDEESVVQPGQDVGSLIDPPRNQSIPFHDYHFGQETYLVEEETIHLEYVHSPFYDVYFGLHDEESVAQAEQDMSSLIDPPRNQSIPFHDYHFGQETYLVEEEVLNNPSGNTRKRLPRCRIQSKPLLVMAVLAGMLARCVQASL